MSFVLNGPCFIVTFHKNVCEPLKLVQYLCVHVCFHFTVTAVMHVLVKGVSSCVDGPYP